MITPLRTSLLCSLSFVLAPFNVHGVPIGGEPASIEAGLVSRSDLLFYLGFNTSNWAPLLGAGSSLDADVSRVSDGFDGSGMQVILRQGTVGISGSGDSSTFFTLRTAGVDDALHDQLHFRYYVKLDPQFPYVQGGKLPGMCAHQAYGSGGNPPPGEGWSARYMWDKAGELYLYAYTQNNTGWGTHILADYNGRRAQLIPGRWHCVEQFIRLNDAGVANGEVRTWLDGNLVLLRNDMVFITADGTGEKVDWNREFGSMFQAFYGGATGDWAPSRDTWMRFDNVVFARNPVGPRAGSGVCAQPVIATPAGTYANRVLVTVTADPGDTVRYTTNGLEPTYYSPIYTGPVLVVASATFKARAFNDAKPYSPLSAQAELSVTRTGAPAWLEPVMASDDAHVRNGGEFNYGDQNYGSSTSMELRSSGFGYERRVVLKFPIATFANVRAARLRLNFSSTGGGSPRVALWEFPAAGWNQSTITWNNRPQEGDLVGAVRPVAATGWQEWDVSNYVAAAVHRGEASVAFTVVALDETPSSLAIASREGASGRPELLLDADVVAAMPPGPPGTPSLANASGLSLTLQWAAPSSGALAVSYEVLRDGVVAGSTESTSLQVTGLQPATSYTFTVRALDANGNRSSPSAPLVASTLPADTEQPSAPSGLAVQALSALSVRLTWSAAADNYGVVGYRVFRDGALLSTTSVAQADVTSLVPGTTYLFSVSALDEAGNPSPVSDAVSHTTPTDTAPPTWQSGYPKADTATGSGFSLRVRLSEPGVVHYVVLADGAAAPTPSQVRAGTGASGVTPLRSGSLAATAESESRTALSGLTSSRPYDVYFAAVDSAGNLQTAATKRDISTTAVDTTPPAFTSGYPKADTITDDGCTLRFRANEVVVAFWVVLPDGVAAPTAAQVRQGLGPTLAAAIRSGRLEDIPAWTERSVVLSGLGSSQAYDLYFVLEDDETPPNAGVVSKRDVTTLPGSEPPPETFASWIASLPASTEERAPDADPDGDGLASLLEYALGSDAFRASSLPAPRLEANVGTAARFCFTPQRRARLRYLVQTSADLATWEDLDVTARIAVGVEVCIELAAADSPPRFARLQVIESP